MRRLGIVVASTRPGRRGRIIADRFVDRAVAHGGFDVDMLDLAEVNLPFFDEPNHPADGIYVHQHTRDWSARVDAADAFVFVMPEYNHGFIAPLKNALDYLHREWNYKPVGFVSYGGIAGGTRAVEMIKNVVLDLKMVPIGNAIVIPRVSEVFDNSGRLRSTDILGDGVDALLDELARLTDALATVRDAVPGPC
jgi:NAD(P)H-dependent FMN reductase